MFLRLTSAVRISSGIHWVRPQLVAEIAFAEWTQNRLLRQPRFEGLRTDKTAREVRREQPQLSTEDIRKAEAAMSANQSSARESLHEYKAKRDFRATPEPKPKSAKSHRKPIFVIQKHDATRLHYDLRLESDGVLKSWAVTKEPTLNPAVKHLAVRVEDHPLAYADFAGDIPRGHYGAGHVEIWDRGDYESAEPDQGVAEGLDAGKLSIVLHGKKMNGRFALVRMNGKKGKRENWLLIKSRDKFVKAAPSNDGAATMPSTPTRRVNRKHRINSNGKPPPKIEITHADKVMFPDAGISKGEVVDYYRKVAKRLLPFLKDRPMTLERLPEGVGPDKPHFWQKHAQAIIQVGYRDSAS